MTEIQHNESFALYAFPKFITSMDRFWNQQYKIVKSTSSRFSFKFYASIYFVFISYNYIP